MTTKHLCTHILLAGTIINKNFCPLVSELQSFFGAGFEPPHTTSMKPNHYNSSHYSFPHYTDPNIKPCIGLQRILTHLYVAWQMPQHTRCGILYLRLQCTLTPKDLLCTHPLIAVCTTEHTPSSHILTHFMTPLPPPTNHSRLQMPLVHNTIGSKPNRKPDYYISLSHIL